MTIDEIVARLDGVRKSGDGYTARCPAHNDHQNSLSVKPGREGRILLNCFVGCAIESIISALGLSMQDLFPQNGGGKSSNTYGEGPAKPAKPGTKAAQGWQEDKGSRRVIAQYPYTDENGELLYQSVRYECDEYNAKTGERRKSPKNFTQRRPDGNGGWVWNLNGVRRVPYHLADLRAAVEAGERIFIAEGEKDADNLRDLGIPATTNPGGAGPGKWLTTYNQHLKGTDVVILPDNDDTGRNHAEEVARQLSTVAASVKILDLKAHWPQIPQKGDVSDWLQDGGGTADKLRELADSCPEWKPTAEETNDPKNPDEVDWTGITLRSLEPDLLPVPVFHVPLLPAALCDWVQDTVIRGGFPPEYVACAVIVALSSLIGRQVGIRPKRYDDWQVIPNLWGAAVGHPGVMKTPAVAEGLKPLQRIEAEARKEYEAAHQAWEQGKAVAQAQAKAAKAKLEAEAKNGATGERLRQLALDLEPAEEPEPKPRRHIVNDGTTEKIGALLRENPNGLLLFRDELMGLLRSTERQGHEQDRQFFLESHAGNNSYTYDRIGRGTIHIPALCLSLFGTIQPGPFAAYVRQSASGEGADGFIPRLQMTTWPDPPKRYKAVDRWPNQEAKDTAWGVFSRLANLDIAGIGAECMEGEEVPFLRFDSEAQAAFDAWREKLENRLLAGRDSPLMLMHLAKYRSLMPSLALIFHLADGGTGPVPLSQVERAIAWCEFLEAHARRLYQYAMDGDPQGAARLAERIRQSLPNPFTSREVVKKGWTGLSTPDEVERACGILEDRGWLQSRDVPGDEKGGRPSVKYWIHPSLRDTEDTDTGA